MSSMFFLFFFFFVLIYSIYFFCFFFCTSRLECKAHGGGPLREGLEGSGNSGIQSAQGAARQTEPNPRWSRWS